MPEPGMPRTTWRMKTFKGIRNHPRLREMEEEFAKVGANAAGDGFVARSGHRPTRARAAVIAATIRARRANRRDHTLMGVALDAMKAHRL